MEETKDWFAFYLDIELMNKLTLNFPDYYINEFIEKLIQQNLATGENI